MIPYCCGIKKWTLMKRGEKEGEKVRKEEKDIKKEKDI